MMVHSTKKEIKAGLTLTAYMNSVTCSVGIWVTPAETDTPPGDSDTR